MSRRSATRPTARRRPRRQAPSTRARSRSRRPATTVKYRAFDAAGNAENDEQPAHPDRHGRALVDDSLQRDHLRGQLLQRRRLGDADGQRRRRLRRLPDRLHDRRLGPLAVERHRLRGRVHALGDDDRQVPRLRQRRQRRADQLGADSGRPDAAVDDAQLRRLALLGRLLVPVRCFAQPHLDRQRLRRRPIRYTTNGTVPTKTTARSTPRRSRSAPTTTINYRAYDNAGNLENNQRADGADRPDRADCHADRAQPRRDRLRHRHAQRERRRQRRLRPRPRRLPRRRHRRRQRQQLALQLRLELGLGRRRQPHDRRPRGRRRRQPGSPTTITVTTGNSNLLQNPGLESGSGNTPTCWALAGYGTNTFTWTWTTDAHSGLRAENLSITSLHERRPQDAQRLQRHLLDCHRRRPQVHDHRLVQVDGAAGHLRLQPRRPARPASTTTWRSRRSKPPPRRGNRRRGRRRRCRRARPTSRSGWASTVSAGDVWMDDFAAFQTG